MKLGVQKRLASEVLKCSPKRVWFDETSLADIKEAITKADVKSLINSGLIGEKPAKGTSRFRARKNLVQRRKGRKKGPGTKRGASGARLPGKEKWMSKIRAQRVLIKLLKQKEVISVRTYRDLYGKAKGGFFRSCRHIKLYATEHKLFQKK